MVYKQLQVCLPFLSVLVGASRPRGRSGTAEYVIDVICFDPSFPPPQWRPLFPSSNPHRLRCQDRLHLKQQLLSFPYIAANWSPMLLHFSKEGRMWLARSCPLLLHYSCFPSFFFLVLASPGQWVSTFWFKGFPLLTHSATVLTHWKSKASRAQRCVACLCLSNWHVLSSCGVEPMPCPASPPACRFISKW